MMAQRLAGARRAFTLIELLVVIAILAILMAAVMPAIAAVNDRSRISECETHLQQVGVALRMYAEDHGRYPAALQALYDERYLDQKELLRCSRAEREYFYRVPGPGAGREDVVVSCVDPGAAAGSRPHRHGSVTVVLQLNGRTRLDDGSGK
jgi:prepilin-type N-terminal cleavage/methylation domain-containing protein